MKVVLIKFFTYAKEEYLGSSIGLNFIYSETLDESGEWSIEVENQDFMEDLDISNEVEIYVDNVLKVDSRISDITYNTVEAGVIYKFSGRDRIDDLFYYPAVSSANFGIENGLNIKYLGALAYLLDKGNWRLGSIETLVDPTQLFVKDLTSEKTLLSQIRKLIQENPDTFYRYGGINNGYHTLDVGDFYEDLGEVVTNKDTNLDNEGYFFLSDPEIQKKDELIEGVYLEGGTFSGQSSVHNPITDVNVYQNINFPVTFGCNRYLENMFVYLQESDIDSQFPIVEVDYGRSFLVLNSELGDGGIIKSHPRFNDNSGACSAAWVLVGANGTSQHVGYAQPFISPGGNISSFSLYIQGLPFTTLFPTGNPPATYPNIRWKILNSKRTTDGGKGWTNVPTPGTTVVDQGLFTPSVTGGRKETITLNTPVSTTAGAIYFLCLELEGQETANRGYALQASLSAFSLDGVNAEDQGEAGNHLDKMNEQNGCQLNHTLLGHYILSTQTSDPGNGNTDWQTVSPLTIPSNYGLRFEMVFDRTKPQYPRVFQEFTDIVPYYGYYEGVAGNADLPAGQGWIYPLKSLYNRAIRFLKKSSEPFFNVSGKVYGEVLSKVGSQMNVQGHWEVDKYDPITGKFIVIEQNIDRPLRLMSKKTEITQQDQSVSLTLNSKTIDFSQNNNTVALYDSLAAQRGSSDTGTINVETYPPKLDAYSLAVSGFTGHSSTIMSDGRVGVLVTFATPTEAYQYDYNTLAYEAIDTTARRERPNRLILAGLPYTSSGEPIDVEVTQWPDIGTPMIAKIAYKNRPWSAGESDTFNYYLLRLS